MHAKALFLFSLFDPHICIDRPDERTHKKKKQFSSNQTWLGPIVSGGTFEFLNKQTGILRRFVQVPGHKREFYITLKEGWKQSVEFRWCQFLSFNTSVSCTACHIPLVFEKTRKTRTYRRFDRTAYFDFWRAWTLLFSEFVCKRILCCCLFAFLVVVFSLLFFVCVFINWWTQ